MAQINDLLVLGKSNFIGEVNTSSLLSAKGGIALTNTTAQSTGLTYVLGIKPFADGGNVIWSNTQDLLVGSATKLSVNGGSSTLPVYFNNGVPKAISDIAIARENTTDTYVKVTNSNGSVGIYTSTNRGLYDWTKSAWIINTTTAGDHTYVPLWKSKGGTTTPVYFNSSGEPVAGTSYAKAIKAITRSGTTFTYTCIDGTTGTFSQQDNNTDTKVTQTVATASDYTNWRPLVIGASNSATEGFTPTTVTDQTYAFNTISAQPSTGTIRATTFKGNATSATMASSLETGLAYSDGDSSKRWYKVATVTKEIWNWTDTYVIDVTNPDDALCALMLVLAIDAEKCSRENH